MNWEYKNNRNNSYRYVLGERGNNTLGCIGINPSTAKPFELDNTMKSVKRIAKHNGYDGWMMYNIYALRATNPVNLPKIGNKTMHLKNIKEIENSVKQLNIKTIWLAYGDLLETRVYLKRFLNDIIETLKPLNLSWQIVNDVTKKGNPRHPLYQAANSELYDYNFDKYFIIDN